MNLLLFALILFYIDKSAAITFVIPSKATYILVKQTPDRGIVNMQVSVIRGGVSLGFAPTVAPPQYRYFEMTIDDFDQGHYRNQVPWSTWPTDDRRWFYMRHIDDVRSKISIEGDDWIGWCWIDGRWITLESELPLPDRLLHGYKDGRWIGDEPPERI